MRLSDFLRTQAARPFSWSGAHCLSMLADWYLISTGRDPIPDFRGRIMTEADCAAVLGDAGGLARFVDRRCRALGAMRLREPVPGCIAVVRYQGRHFGALRTATGRWAIKGHDGLVVTGACRLVAAWEPR